MTRTYNCRISETFLELGEDNMLTFYLWMEGEHNYSFGGYCMGYLFKPTRTYTGAVIIDILNTVGVDSWEKIKGSYVRADVDDGKVIRIGNIILDRWFDMEDYKTMLKEDNENV